jgi:hypothetical protein
MPTRSVEHRPALQNGRVPECFSGEELVREIVWHGDSVLDDNYIFFRAGLKYYIVEETMTVGAGSVNRRRMAHLVWQA